MNNEIKLSSGITFKDEPFLCDSPMTLSGDAKMASEPCFTLENTVSFVSAEPRFFGDAKMSTDSLYLSGNAKIR